jgi:hypothetical protein
MKKLRLPLIALLTAGLLTIAFIGCKKDLKSPALTSDATYSTVSTAFALWMDVNVVSTTSNCNGYSVAVDAFESFKNSHRTPQVSAKDRLTITITNNEGNIPVGSYAPDVDANTTGIQTFCLPAGCYTILAHFSHAASDASPVTIDVSAPLCVGLETVTCVYSQGYWFANNSQHPSGVHPWPNDITIGGFTYTNAEGLAIWNTSNQGGITDAQKVFEQLAAVYLSGLDYSSTSISGDVAIIENWLTSLHMKLSPTYLPMESDDDININFGDVRIAADNISAYIHSHECTGN